MALHGYDPKCRRPPTIFQGVETYAFGGGYSEADQLSFTPGYLATAGYGVWQLTGSQTFLLTYINLTYAPATTAVGAPNIPTGSSKVRQIAKFDNAGKTYSGSGDFAYYDLTGAVVPGGSGTFTITAVKIQLEQPQ